MDDYKENNLYEKAFEFSVRIVKLYQNICTEHKEYILSRQILKSGTSIGANIAEAFGGISKADFSAKISIAYKESLETKYWLKLLFRTGYLTQNLYLSFNSDCDQLSRILFTMLKNMRIKKPVDTQKKSDP